MESFREGVVRKNLETRVTGCCRHRIGGEPVAFIGLRSALLGHWNNKIIVCSFRSDSNASERHMRVTATGCFVWQVRVHSDVEHPVTIRMQKTLEYCPDGVLARELLGFIHSQMRNMTPQLGAQNLEAA
eukprot:1292921-Amphidinium_carterae.1